MADFHYLETLFQITKAGLNLSTATFGVMLCMTNTNADADTQRKDAIFLTDITLDECDGANYTRQTLNSFAHTKEGASFRLKQDAQDSTFPLLGAGTRSNKGCLIYFEAASDSLRRPWLWIASGGFPVNGDGSDFKIVWNASGIHVYTT